MRRRQKPPLSTPTRSRRRILESAVYGRGSMTRGPSAVTALLLTVLASRLWVGRGVSFLERFHVLWSPPDCAGVVFDRSISHGGWRSRAGHRAAIRRRRHRRGCGTARPHADVHADGHWL